MSERLTTLTPVHARTYMHARCLNMKNKLPMQLVVIRSMFSSHLESIRPQMCERLAHACSHMRARTYELAHARVLVEHEKPMQLVR
jgi:hypothetical protein